MGARIGHVLSIRPNAESTIDLHLPLNLRREGPKLLPGLAEHIKQALHSRPPAMFVDSAIVIVVMR